MPHSCWETVAAENNQGQRIQSAKIYNRRDIGGRDLVHKTSGFKHWLGRTMFVRE